MKTSPHVHPRGSRSERWPWLSGQATYFTHTEGYNTANCIILQKCKKRKRHLSFQRNKLTFYSQEYFTCYFAPQRVQEPLLQLLSSSSPPRVFLSAGRAPAAPTRTAARSLPAYDKMNSEISVLCLENYLLVLFY